MLMELRNMQVIVAPHHTIQRNQVTCHELQKSALPYPIGTNQCNSRVKINTKVKVLV
uniref:ABC transporter family protein n=1 Tax=Arundo donax TaxID=35708 RepID=A0A0A9E2E1_ARUDO